MRLDLIQPVVLLIFAAAIGGLWAWRRNNRQLIALAVGFALFACGMFVQMLRIPDVTVVNSLTSTAFYCSGALAVSLGFMLRAGATRGRGVLLGMAATVLVLDWLFAAIWPDVLMRVYVVNFGLGTILLTATWFSRALARGSTTDKVLFWVLAVLAAHFFPRTLFTAGSVSGTSGSIDGFAQTSFWSGTVFSVAILGAAVGVTVIIATMLDALDSMQRERDTDALTGIANRRGLELGAQDILAAGSTGPVSLILCDIDRFKSINDRHGHPAGDEVLKSFAATLVANTRGGDLVARLGGEEFVILLPGLNAEQGYSLAERLRLAVAATSLAHIAPGLSVTCSLGVVQMKTGESFAEALSRADEQVYAAKYNGRNRTQAEGIGPARRRPA